MRRFREVVFLFVGLLVGAAFAPRVHLAWAQPKPAAAQVTFNGLTYDLDLRSVVWQAADAKSGVTSYPVVLVYKGADGEERARSTCITTNGDFLWGACGDGKFIISDADVLSATTDLQSAQATLITRIATLAQKGIIPAP